MAKYPLDLIIRPLQPEEWRLVEEIYTGEFENQMPENYRQSTFIGVFLGEELVGFAHVEQIFHLNAVYLNPEHRRRGFERALFDTIDRQIPRNAALVILPDAPLDRLIKSYGFRALGGDSVYRKDY